MPLLEQREARFCSTHRPCGIELYPNHDSKGQRPSEHGRYDQEDGDKVEGDCAADRGKPYQETKVKEWHYGRITGKPERTGLLLVCRRYGGTQFATSQNPVSV